MFTNEYFRMHFPFSQLHVSRPAELVILNLNALIPFCVHKYWNSALGSFANILFLHLSLLNPNTILSISFSSKEVYGLLRSDAVYYGRKVLTFRKTYSVFRHWVLWNVGNYLPNYTTSHPWWLLYSHSLSQEISNLTLNVYSSFKFHTHIAVYL
jgi:hypothetical protein